MINQTDHPSHWQLQIILEYVDDIPISEVNWLLTKSNFAFWTYNHSRTSELIDRLDRSRHDR